MQLNTILALTLDTECWWNCWTIYWLC